MTEVTDCLQFLSVRLILDHELPVACFCAGNIVRGRLPVLALGSVHQVLAKTVVIVRLNLDYIAHIHDLSVVGTIILPENRLFRVWVHVTHEVDNAPLEEFCEILVDRGNEWGRWVILFEGR